MKKLIKNTLLIITTILLTYTLNSCTTFTLIKDLSKKPVKFSFDKWNRQERIHPMTDKKTYVSSMYKFGTLYQMKYCPRKSKIILSIYTKLILKAGYFPTEAVLRVDSNPPEYSSSTFCEYGTWTGIVLNQTILDQLSKGSKLVISLGTSDDSRYNNTYRSFSDLSDMLKAYNWLKEKEN